MTEAKSKNDFSSSTAGIDKVSKKECLGTIRFSQDGLSVTICTAEGFRVFDVLPNGDIVMIYDIRNFANITHIQRLYNSNLIAFVTSSNPRMLRLFNMRRNEVIGDHRYEKPVVWIAMSRTRLVVATEERLYVHKVRNMDLLQAVSRDTNPKHLFAMSSQDIRGYLAFPVDKESGRVQVLDLDNCKRIHEIEAHRASVEVLCMDEQATRLATGSCKGTVIRVFDLLTGLKLHEFRRGLRNALLHSLSFSPSGEYLACTSDQETVHLFKVPTDYQRRALAENQGWLNSIGSVATQATGTICPEVERFIAEERAFVTVQNPYHGNRTLVNVCSPAAENHMRVQICSPNGFLSALSLGFKDGEWACEVQRAYFVTELIKDSKEKDDNARTR